MPTRQPPAPEAFDALIVTAPGLEPLALAELSALGVVATHDEPGVVTARLAMRDVMRANLHLRTVSRVAVRLAHFKALTFADVEKHAKRVPWERVLAPGVAVRFRVTCRKSRLYHSGAVAQRLMDAVRLKFPEVDAAAERAHDDDGAEEQLFIVRVIRDQLTLSADASGELLHRRGYRQALAKAPLRETLAAAMLMGAGWDGSTPFADPMCGSGTIAIEAAMIARRMAPGLRRRFAFEQWPGHDAKLWRAVQKEAHDAERPSAPVPILASDRDAGAISATRANAERAGVLGDLTIAQQAVSALALPETPGLVMVNPPYGIRVGDKKPLRNLFAQIGNVLRERAPRWRFAMLSADRELDGQVRLRFDEQWRSSNGGIPIRLVMTEVPSHDV